MFEYEKYQGRSAELRRQADEYRLAKQAKAARKAAKRHHAWVDGRTQWVKAA